MRLFIIPFLFLLLGCLATAQPQLDVNQKLAPTLQALQTQPQARSTTPVLWSVSVTDTAAFRQFLVDRLIPSAIPGKYALANIILLKASPNIIFEKILPSDLVTFIDRADRSPHEELAVSYLDLSANKVNLVHRVLPAINGNGLTVSIKENDFDQEDIDFTGRVVPSSAGSGLMTNHATIMASIISGGGNTYYESKGVAWNANLTSTNFLNLLPESKEYYDTLNIAVQNHSYGVGLENYYGNDAAAYDASVTERPSLLHVFSSGNSGDQADTIGAYAGLVGYANLTGNFKMAKNLLTVGSMDSLGFVPLQSSKGPAYDGRVKPELVAFALDGTSGAAAIVSGIALLLQQTYRDTHAGQLPPAALVKAILLNSADDVEAPGIDFTSGYGRANAWRSIQTMLQSHYFSGVVKQEETVSFPINVPANVRNLKITLAWTDPPGAPNAEKALVNDLDLTLFENSNGQIWLPWALNSAPNLDSLTKLPTRKADHLNNIEQISLGNPTPGAFDIRVSGFKLATTNQDFYLAYQFDTTGYFQWTFPAKGDNIITGKEAILRWESTLMAASGKLEYSLDDGKSWTLISDVLHVEDGYYRWQAPDLLAIAQLRLTVDSQIYVSEKFTLSQPLKLEIGFNCPDSVLLYWSKLPNAEAYTLYGFEGDYVAPVLNTSDTFVILSKETYSSQYFAVAPTIGTGSMGVRSFALNYNNQGVGCYIKNFLADLAGDEAFLQLSLGTAYQVQSISFEQFIAGVFVTIVTFPVNNQTEFQYNEPDLKTGRNTFRARVTLANGAILYSDPADLYYVGKVGYFIYPNPASLRGTLNVLSKGVENQYFILYDALGRKVLTYPLESVSDAIPIQNLPSGVYFYWVLQGKTSIGQGKLVIRP